MAVPRKSNEYALGSDEVEQERLIRQSAWLTAPTERLFRRAGIGQGQRVLDLGSGVGAVALIAGRLVGTSGEVLGVERDARAIARAAARMSELGLKQVRFVQSDVADLATDRPFDAAVGRYILMYLRDPVAALRAVAGLVRPGGALAFQEPHWEPFLEACAGLPLWRAAAALMAEAFVRTGASVRIGPELSAVFAASGLPAPDIHTDMLVGAERWMPDVLISLVPQINALNLPLVQLGDLATLYQRLMAEAALHQVPAPLPGLISAWVRKPG